MWSATACPQHLPVQSSGLGISDKSRDFPRPLFCQLYRVANHSISRGCLRTNEGHHESFMIRVELVLDKLYTEKKNSPPPLLLPTAPRSSLLGRQLCHWTRGQGLRPPRPCGALTAQGKGSHGNEDSHPDPRTPALPAGLGQAWVLQQREGVPRLYLFLS